MLSVQQGKIGYAQEYTCCSSQAKHPPLQYLEIAAPHHYQFRDSFSESQKTDSGSF